MVRTTPLLILRNCSHDSDCYVYGKLEIYNPTGSHKDRESEDIVRYALSNGYSGTAIASTGNAGISLAAYAYVQGLKCHVYLPKGISPERLAQIQAYHPVVKLAAGYEEAIVQCEEDAKKLGLLNCNPGARFEKITGDSKIGLEIASRIKPDYVVCPTNNGTLLAGVWMGLKKAKVRTRMVAAVAKKTILADAIAGFHQIDKLALFRALRESKGEVIDVSDAEIAEAARLLISDGLIVEGAAAAAIASLKHLNLSRKTKVCCVITGTGLKFPQTLKQLLKKS